MIEVYFANKQGTVLTPIFNQRPESMMRKSVQIVDKEGMLRQKIYIDIKSTANNKLKINPNLFNIPLTSVCENEKTKKFELIDDLIIKYEEKRKQYQQIMQLSNLNKGDQSPKKIPKDDPVTQFMNLTGSNKQTARFYLTKGRTLQKAFEFYGSVEQFMKNQKVDQKEALFYLESSNFNVNQASQLLKMSKQ